MASPPASRASASGWKGLELFWIQFRSQFQRLVTVTVQFQRLVTVTVVGLSALGVMSPARATAELRRPVRGHGRVVEFYEEMRQRRWWSTSVVVAERPVQAGPTTRPRRMEESHFEFGLVAGFSLRAA